MNIFMHLQQIEDQRPHLAFDGFLCDLGTLLKCKNSK